jgi:hypothetical protein
MANELKSFMLNEDFTLQLAINPSQAMSTLRGHISSSPELEAKYGTQYDKIFADPELTRKWRAAVDQAWQTEGVKQKYMAPKAGLPEIPAGPEGTLGYEYRRCS